MSDWQTSLCAAWGCAALAAVIAVAGWYTALKEHHGGTAATAAAAAAAQPDTWSLRGRSGR